MFRRFELFIERKELDNGYALSKNEVRNVFLNIDK
jgi:lysyl-tRNA synthetase class II